MTTTPVMSITDEQIAEIEEAAASKMSEGFLLVHNLSCYDILALISRLRAAERDAGRYRWLCDGNGYFMEEAGLCGATNDKGEADRQIDDAMAAKEG